MSRRSPRLPGPRLLLTALLLFGMSWMAGGRANAQQDYTSFYRPEIYTWRDRPRETGLRLGRFRLHGALGLSNGYDSNALYAQAAPEGDYVVRVVPGADLVVASPRLDLNTGYRFTLNEYAQSDVQDSQDHDAHLDLSYRLSRRLVFKAGDHFLSTSDPADVEIPERVGRISNEARGEIRYVTPGEDLDLGIRYTNTFTEYDATLDALSYYNNKVAVTSRFNVSSQFRFLPKSTATASFEYGRTDFNEAEPPAVSNSDSQAIFLSAGLTSQFSRKFSASARIGGTLLYFDTGPDESTVVGGLDLQLQPAERLTFLLGYEYSSQISTFTNYHDDHVARVEARWKFARKFEAMEAFQVSYLDFSPPNVLPNGETRRDWVYQNLFRVSYAVVEWGKLRVEYQYDRRDSNAVTTIGAASGDFTKHRATLGFDVYY